MKSGWSLIKTLIFSSADVMENIEASAAPAHLYVAEGEEIFVRDLIKKHGVDYKVHFFVDY